MAFLRLIRIKNLLLVVLFQYLLRYWLIIPILNKYEVAPVLSDFRFALLVVATMLLTASGYVINDYFDIKIDTINRPKRVLIGKSIKRRQALFLHVLLTFFGVFIGFFISYVARKENYALMFLLVPVLLWYYSTTFKKQVLIGNLVIALMTALVAYLVVSFEFAMLIRVHGNVIITSEACSVAWFWTSGFAFFAFVTTLCREIIKDMEDVQGDKSGGCHTLPIEIGINYSKVIVGLLLLFTCALVWGVYMIVPEFKEQSMVLWYFLILLTLPLVVLGWIVFRARSPKNFHLASVVIKLVMLAGVLFVVMAGQIFV